MTDTLVFDIETQNFFTDPGVGWNNFGALKISVVGVYSYERSGYFTFEENEMEKMAPLFANAARLVGFASNRYDIPVLNLYFRKLKGMRGLNLWAKERVDLLDEIETQTGGRISLSRLAEANLGEAKSGHGSEAVQLYAAGQMDQLKEYCLKDVELTKRLYDLFTVERAFLIPDRVTGEVRKLEFSRTIAKPTAPLL